MQTTTTIFSIVTAVIFSTLTLVPTEAKPIHLEARKSMSGDATYYGVGLGSCGDTNSDDEMVVALSESLMGSGAKSSYCGQSITVKGGSGSVTVKVVDTCPSCGSGDIDLSPAAFKKLGDLSEGVIPVTWSL